LPSFFQKACEVDGRVALLALRRERNILTGVSFLLLFSLRLLLAKKKVIALGERPEANGGVCF